MGGAEGEAEGEGAAEGENNNENEGEEEPENYMGDAETAPREEAQEDGEGWRRLAGSQGTCWRAKPSFVRRQ